MGVLRCDDREVAGAYRGTGGSGWARVSPGCRLAGIGGRRCDRPMGGRVRTPLWSAALHITAPQSACVWPVLAGAAGCGSCIWLASTGAAWWTCADSDFGITARASAMQSATASRRFLSVCPLPDKTSPSIVATPASPCRRPLLLRSRRRARSHQAAFAWHRRCFRIIFRQAGARPITTGKPPLVSAKRNQRGVHPIADMCSLFDRADSLKREKYSLILRLGNSRI